jgi:ATP-dependent 26S proteasome regulatory subunit
LKTLLAFKLARIAVKNNWIFIYLKDPTLLAEVLRMSKIIDRSGNGALVFLEDIDQVTRGNRDAAMQDILNTLDGGDTKNMNVISLFTTNHIEVIEPTFLRGKRIGTIISMGFLDADTTKRFLEESFKIGGYKITEDITNECQLVAESSIAPAFMAEIVEAIKARLVFDDRQEVTAQDIRYAITSYLHQVELSKIKPISASPAEQIADNLKKILKTDEMQKAIADIQEQLED